MSRARTWYASVDGVTYGPYTVAELKKAAADQRLKPSDFLWNEGMSDWTRADEMDGLFVNDLPPTRTSVASNSSAALCRVIAEKRGPQFGSGSKPVFSDLFSARGRRNRKSYAYFSLVAILICAGALLVALVAGETTKSPLPMILVTLCVILPVLISGLFVSAQRFRDFGWPGAAVFLFCVPLLGIAANLALLIVPGSVGGNRYGDDPTHS